jgi:hypothetical protein
MDAQGARRKAQRGLLRDGATVGVTGSGSGRALSTSNGLHAGRREERTASAGFASAGYQFLYVIENYSVVLNGVHSSSFINH